VPGLRDTAIYGPNVVNSQLGKAARTPRCKRRLDWRRAGETRQNRIGEGEE
jgi:hypothetical protein